MRPFQAILALLASFLTAASGFAAAGIRPEGLTCEYLSNPLGIDATKPQLGWVLRTDPADQRGQSRTAYQVLVASGEAAATAAAKAGVVGFHGGLQRFLLGRGEETWEPRFTYHGFRWVEVTGWPDKPTLASLCGRVAYTSFAQAGSFQCSNDLANKIQQCTLWSCRSNFVGYPTDCPHREKNGWTGDAHLAAEQAMFNVSNAAAYENWMNNFKDEQQESGELPGIVPTSGWGSAGWPRSRRRQPTGLVEAPAWQLDPPCRSQKSDDVAPPGFRGLEEGRLAGDGMDAYGLDVRSVAKLRVETKCAPVAVEEIDVTARGDAEIATLRDRLQVVTVPIRERMASLHRQGRLLLVPILEFVAPQLIEPQGPEHPALFVPDHSVCRNERRFPDRLVWMGKVEEDQTVALGVDRTGHHDAIVRQQFHGMGVRRRGIPDHPPGRPLPQSTAARRGGDQAPGAAIHRLTVVGSPEGRANGCRQFSALPGVPRPEHLDLAPFGGGRLHEEHLVPATEQERLGSGGGNEIDQQGGCEDGANRHGQTFLLAGVRSGCHLELGGIPRQAVGDCRLLEGETPSQVLLTKARFFHKPAGQNRGVRHADCTVALLDGEMKSRLVRPPGLQTRGAFA